MSTASPRLAGVPDGAPHLLVIDDDARIRTLLSRYLSEAGYRVTAAASANEARARLAGLTFDLLILDVMMPGETGVDFARALRRTSQVPILMLTALGDPRDRINGLESGVDDYVSKPFEPRELVARVRAHLRRVSAERPEDVTPRRWGDLEVDIERREVRRGQNVLELTRSEFELLATMTRHPGRVYTRLQLLEASQGDAYEGYERTIDSHVKNLRHKIEPDPHRPRYVQTVFGVGYRAAPTP